MKMKLRGEIMIRAIQARVCCAFVMLLLALASAGATKGQQTTAFTYQGRLTDGGAPANTNYDLQFTLWDALSGGTQQPQPAPAALTKTNVAVTGGVFSVLLDFGVSAFPGADRFLEVGVRPGGSGGDFTILAPRQQISSTPYALRTLNATAADSLSSACVGCVTDAQIKSVSGSKVTGTIPAASLPTDSTSYIQNRRTPQTNSNFNISGDGVIGGDLTVTGKLNGNISGNFIQNGTALQNNANFNISGNGFIGGNVGIGTSNPASRLEVETPLSSYGFVHSTPRNVLLGQRSIKVGSFAGTGSSGVSAGVTGGWLGTLSTDPLLFFVDNGGASMMINTNGNVGIGTINPTSKLEIAARDGLKISGN